MLVCVTCYARNYPRIAEVELCQADGPCDLCGEYCQAGELTEIEFYPTTRPEIDEQEIPF